MSIYSEVFAHLQSKGPIGAPALARLVGLTHDQIRHAVWKLKNIGAATRSGEHPAYIWTAVPGYIMVTPDKRGRDQASNLNRTLGPKRIAYLCSLGKANSEPSEVEGLNLNERTTYLVSVGREVERRNSRRDSYAAAPGTIPDILRSCIIGKQSPLRIRRLNKVSDIRDGKVAHMMC